MWKSIGEKYAVSDSGEIFSVRAKRNLKPSTDKAGYKVVTLYGERLYVHRLVAELFVKGDTQLVVNHIDANKQNNRASNLEWVTRAQNVAHAVSKGLNSCARGENSGKAKLTEQQVRDIRMLLAKGYSQRKIAKFFGVSRGPIDRIHRNLGWRHVA